MPRVLEPLAAVVPVVAEMGLPEFQVVVEEEPVLVVVEEEPQAWSLFI